MIPIGLFDPELQPEGLFDITLMPLGLFDAGLTSSDDSSEEEVPVIGLWGGGFFS